jgi:uncharacterized membrane protein
VSKSGLRLLPIIAAAIALIALVLATEMSPFAPIYAGVAIVAVAVAIGRDAGWADYRIVVGIILVVVAALVDYGGKGYAYPGGPHIDEDAQAMMVLAGILLAIIGWTLLIRAAIRPKRAQLTPKSG